MPEAIRQPKLAAHGDAPSRYELVVLAASAGGIEATREILSSLPADFPLPIAILQHRAPTRTSVLSKILARGSPLTVRDAADGDLIEPGTVYLAPSDAHMTVTGDRRVRLMDGKRINFVRSSAEPLLVSAAHSLDGRVVAVVLTGGGRNGANAIRVVKALGGTVIAQDPSSAKQRGMPDAAIATGAVDYVLPLEEIAPMLTRLAIGDGHRAPVLVPA